MKKKAALKIVHLKNPKPKDENIDQEMVNLIRDELNEIVDLLEAEFAKPLSAEEEE